MTKRKKGFTIVELVIVIAVIGILAGILIPTFANLIHNANVASDGALIRELNNALASDLNQPHETIYDALQATDEFGFNVQRINAKARNNKILWDSKNDVFCYLQDDVIEYQNADIKNADKLAAGDYRLWVCSQTIDSEYSTYLYRYNGEQNITTTKGLDTSDSTNAGKIDSVKYDRHDATVAQNVVIRTNGEALTIDAPLDNVKHYGEASSLNVIAVAGSSYRENGKVAFVEISKGRIVLEASSEVNHIHVNAKTETTFDTVIIAKEANVEMPTLSRDDVEIASQGTLVVALQNGTGEVNAQSDIDYVWLTKQGIYEQIKVSNSATNAGNVWVNTSNKPAETKEAAQQIANNIGLTATVGAQEYNVSVNEDRDIVLTTTNEVTGLEEVAYTITADNSGNTVIKDAENNEVAEEVAQQVQNGAVEAQPDKENVQIGATLFAGGSGSENDPFLIVDYATFQHISDLYDEGYYYFKVKDGITAIDLRNNQYVLMNGSFNGNNVVFTNVNAGMFGVVGTGNENDTKPVTLKNFTVQNKGGWGIVYSCGATTLNFDNISVTGYSLHNWNAGEFVRYGSANASDDGFDYTINFTNCACNAEIYSTQNALSTILVGHTYPGTGHIATLNIDTYTDEHINDSVLYYTGTAKTPEGHKYYGMGGVQVYVNGVEKNATDNKAAANIVKIDSTKNPVKTSSGYSITTQSDTTKVVVSLLWQYTEWTNNYGSKLPDLNGVGGTIGTNLTFDVAGTTELEIFESITSVEIRTGTGKFDYEVVNGKLILYMDTTNPYIDGNVTIFVEQFTSGSNIAKYKGSLRIASKTTSSEWVIQ